MKGWPQILYSLGNCGSQDHTPQPTKDKDQPTPIQVGINVHYQKIVNKPNNSILHSEGASDWLSMLGTLKMKYRWTRETPVILSVKEVCVKVLKLDLKKSLNYQYQVNKSHIPQNNELVLIEIVIGNAKIPNSPLPVVVMIFSQKKFPPIPFHMNLQTKKTILKMRNQK